MSEIKRKKDYSPLSVCTVNSLLGVYKRSVTNSVTNNCWCCVIAFIVNVKLSTIVNIQCAALLCLTVSDDEDFLF